MIKTYVKVKGLRELEASLKKLPEAVAIGEMGQVLRQAGKPVAEQAASLAPVKTGKLRRSIRVGSQLTKAQKAISPKLSSVEVYIGVSKSLPQGVWQEFGTFKHEAHPFMRPAWDALRTSVLDSIKELTWGRIKKAAERLAAKSAKVGA